MYDEADPPLSRSRSAIVARPDAAANRNNQPRAAHGASAPARSIRIDPLRRPLQPSACPAPPSPSRPYLSPGWPADIAFLVHYGVAPAALSAAVAAAKHQGVSAAAALLADSPVSESHFYRSLARHLRLPFIEGEASIATASRYPQAIHAGVSPLGGTGPAFLLAPREAAIGNLILSAYRGELHGRFAITTPTHFARLLQTAFRAQVLRDASFALVSLDPALCTRQPPRRPAHPIDAMPLLFVAALGVAGATGLWAPLLSIAFFATVVLRLLASAAACDAPASPPLPLPDHALPRYSIVIALYHEARIVPQLIAALDSLDYPRAKLDIKFVIEEDDRETYAALRRNIRSSGHEIIVAPEGNPRTKPRALNVALPLLRGEFVTVFDAEDIPGPTQIRSAAERFMRAPRELACLQARLAIDNLADGWLPHGIMAQTPQAI
ncbi:MAG TPA: glycosyltransferase [Methylovirgula sp.]